MKQFSWSEETKIQWNMRADYWHKHSIEMWDQGSRKDIIPFFRQHVPIGHSIADLGCGDGYGSFLFWKEGYDVTGMDISEEMVKIAKKHEQLGLAFVLGDLNNPPFSDNQFDGIVAINSLEWVEQPLHALNECKRIVKPNGCACFGILGPTAQPRKNSYARLTGDHVICNTMMPWEFEALAVDHGWEKIAEHGVYKRGVASQHLQGLSRELKQALTFLTLFMMKNIGKEV